ncbi:MAG TPA: TadE/TadG family type IV pilus assembly protein [Novosphingobium sp.]
MRLDFIRRRWPELWRNVDGAVAVETAIVVPVLALLALGSFDVSRMVSRQQELQNGISQAEAIILAAGAGSTTSTTEIRSILAESLSLSEKNVEVEKRYRCDDASTLVSDPATCNEGAVVSSYINVTLADTYVPMWRNFGISKTMEYNISRTVQIS